jgi:hypothetical protein
MLLRAAVEILVCLSPGAVCVCASLTGDSCGRALLPGSFYVCALVQSCWLVVPACVWACGLVVAGCACWASCAHALYTHLLDWLVCMPMLQGHMCSGVLQGNGVQACRLVVPVCSSVDLSLLSAWQLVPPARGPLLAVSVCALGEYGLLCPSLSIGSCAC